MRNSYYHDTSSNPPGVYLIKGGIMSYDRQTRKWTTSYNEYIVRIPISGPPGVTTISKCCTREEAGRVFLDRCPDHKGEIPYYEVGNYMLERSKKR